MRSTKKPGCSDIFARMFQTLLVKLARTLDGAGLPYMVIGGQAVLRHGEPRLTRDLLRDLKSIKDGL